MICPFVPWTLNSRGLIHVLNCCLVRALENFSKQFGQKFSLFVFKFEYLFLFNMEIHIILIF